jgi:ppGpp synthetase/RelA/SpoT-type nucleotidyltranferase
MKLVNPQKYSKSQVNKAGMNLANNSLSEKERNQYLEILGDWRGAHSYPLHIFKKTLKNYSEQIDPNAIIAQRLKRVPSIIKKLNRSYEFSEGKIKLTRMQDIAGCRAIVRSVEEVNELRHKYKTSKLRHEKVRESDYVLEPKEDGYRGIHLIYKYRSDKERKEYNGLLIEIQLRTKLQHIWATAVETTGFFIGQALKLAEGEEKWNEFFRLISSAFAKMEKCPIVSNTPSNEKKLYSLIKEKEKELKVITLLKRWHDSMRIIEDLTSINKDFFILELDLVKENVSIIGFSKKEEEKALKMYSDIEKRIYGDERYDVVFVGVDDIKDLKHAYPNYFADTKEFIKLLEKIISKVD